MSKFEALPGVPMTDTICLSDGSEIENSPEALERHRREVHSGIISAIERSRRERAQETAKRCPFQYDPERTTTPTCKRTCAAFVGDSCALAARPALVDTAGKPCPLRRFHAPCEASCAMYNQGCTLTNAAAAQADQ